MPKHRWSDNAELHGHVNYHCNDAAVMFTPSFLHDAGDPPDTTTAGQSADDLRGDAMGGRGVSQGLAVTIGAKSLKQAVGSCVPRQCESEL